MKVSLAAVLRPERAGSASALGGTKTLHNVHKAGQTCATLLLGEQGEPRYMALVPSGDTYYVIIAIPIASHYYTMTVESILA